MIFQKLEKKQYHEKMSLQHNLHILSNQGIPQEKHQVLKTSHIYIQLLQKLQ